MAEPVPGDWSDPIFQAEARDPRMEPLALVAEPAQSETRVPSAADEPPLHAPRTLAVPITLSALGLAAVAGVVAWQGRRVLALVMMAKWGLHLTTAAARPPADLPLLESAPARVSRGPAVAGASQRAPARKASGPRRAAADSDSALLRERR
jgi:hypothetical protein